MMTGIFMALKTSAIGDDADAAPREDALGEPQPQAEVIYPISPDPSRVALRSDAVARLKVA
jgi:hypothetical protein